MSKTHGILPVMFAVSLALATACDDPPPRACFSEVVEFTLTEAAPGVRVVSTLSPLRAEPAFAEVAGKFHWDEEGVGPIAVSVIGSPTTSHGTSLKSIGHKFFADGEVAKHEVSVARLDDTSDAPVSGFVSVRGEADRGCSVSIEVTPL